MYSTDDALLLEFPIELLEEITGGTSFDTDKTALARERADDLIDSFLKIKYDVPLESPVPPIIEKISVDLTVAMLCESKRMTGFMPETVLFRKQRAIELLDDIAKGKLILSSAGSSSALISNVGTNHDIFPDDILDDFFDGEM